MKYLRFGQNDKVCLNYEKGEKGEKFLNMLRIQTDLHNDLNITNTDAACVELLSEPKRLEENTESKTGS